MYSNRGGCFQQAEYMAQQSGNNTKGQGLNALTDDDITRHT